MADSLRDDRGIGRTVNNCEVCGCVVNLKLCARCKKVAYCSKEHQKQAWSQHKNICTKLKDDLANIGDKSCSSNAPSMGVVNNQLSTLSIDCKEASSAVTSQQQRVMHHSTDGDKKDELFGLFTQEFDSPGSACKQNILSDEAHTLCENATSNSISDIQSASDLCKEFSEANAELYPVTESGSSEKFILETEELEIHAPDYTHQESDLETHSGDGKMPYFSVIEARNKALGDYVTKCLNSYGLCVIDNFLGDSKGTDILDEVADMYDSGELTSGQLVNTSSPKGAVRGDVITWIDGTDLGCNNVTFLVSSIDAIMLHCQRSLGHYHIKGRSKAMVAAYPGNKTGFLRHVDNPSGDGRCVTCIYYLNKGWSSKVDGGLLRIFPEGTNRVANVEPKFDRLLFFWSDRRNPHEVLPAFRLRYAVTVWYYDEQERRRAVKKFKVGGGIDAKPKQVIPIGSGMSSTT